MTGVQKDLAVLALNFSPSPYAAEQPRKEKPMKITSRARRTLGIGLVCGLATVLVSQCSETVAPSPPSQITIESGNNQYSLRGTTLRDPLVVKVRAADGTIPEEAYVVFSVIEGGGSLENASVRIDGKGVASTEFTLGPEFGPNTVRAAIKENSSKSVLFEATAANFYCPEQSDTLAVHYAALHDLFLVTRKSSLYPNPSSAGVVGVGVFLPHPTTAFAEIAGGITFSTNVFDAAFSARGDFYVARRLSRSEILKIDTFGNVTFFAHLDEDLPIDDFFAEIATNPSGLLVGCDAKGPFVVGCPDTLTRFEAATYPGFDINSDALAVDPRRQADDPLGEDIYFIDETTSSLMRLAMDSLAVEATRPRDRRRSHGGPSGERARNGVRGERRQRLHPRRLRGHEGDSPGDSRGSGHGSLRFLRPGSRRRGGGPEGSRVRRGIPETLHDRYAERQRARL